MLSKCWEEEDPRGGAEREREAPACAKLQQSPHSAIPVARVPPGHGSSRRTASSSDVARLPALGPPYLQKQKAKGQSQGGLQKSRQAYSPQLFLSLRLLAMVVGGLVAVRRCHCAGSSPRLQVAGNGRLCARARRSSLRLGDVAAALVRRSGEEKGGERG